MIRPLIVGLALFLACATAPEPPAAGKASAWGFVRIVPREGVTPGSAGSGSYGDRRLRDVEFVDYSRPGFAVVYADAPPPTKDAAHIAIHEAAVRVRLDPAYAAVAAGGSLIVENATEQAHVLSVPSAALIQRLSPGERTEITAESPGALRLFLLDVPGAEAQVFVAPGPYAVVSEPGRFELSNLDPGRVRLHAWHPRFPPASRWLDLAPDGVARLDFELRVDAQGNSDAAP